MRLPLASPFLEAIRHPGALISGDRGNIRRLAEQLDCSPDDAAELYRLARRDGYPSAYRSVFGVSEERRLRQRQALPRSTSGRFATAPGGSRAAGDRAH